MTTAPHPPLGSCSSPTRDGRQMRLGGEAVPRDGDATPTTSSSSLGLPRNDGGTPHRGPDGRLWTAAMHHRHRLLADRPSGRGWTSRKLAMLTHGVTKATALLRFFRDRAPTTGHAAIPAAAQRAAFFRRPLRRRPHPSRDTEGKGTVAVGVTPTATVNENVHDPAEAHRSDAEPDVTRGLFVSTPKKRKSWRAGGGRPPTLSPECVAQWDAAGVRVLWEVLWHILAVRHRILHERLPSFVPSSSSSSSTPEGLLEARAFPLFGLVVDVCEGVRFHLSANPSSRWRRPWRRHATARASAPSVVGGGDVSTNPPLCPASGPATPDQARRVRSGDRRLPMVSRGLVVQETARYVSVALFPEGWSCLSPPSASGEEVSPTSSSATTHPPVPLLPGVSPSLCPLRVVHIQKVFPSGAPGTLHDVCDKMASSWQSGRGRRGSTSPRRKANEKQKRTKKRTRKDGLDHRPDTKGCGPSTGVVVSRSLVVVVGEYWEIEKTYCRCATSPPSPSRLLYDRCL